MLPNKKKLRSNNLQLQMLVDYMAAHRDFANGEFTGPLGPERMRQQWEQVRAMLSEHGPDKSVEQWKHTWRDLKKKSRGEGASIRQARETTGNTSFVPALSETSTKVLNIIGKECAFGIGEPGETAIGSFISRPRPATTTVVDTGAINEDDVYAEVQHPTWRPEPQPASWPVCQSGLQPTMQPALRPGLQPASQPGLQPPSQPGLQPASRPRLQPAMQPASQPASQPGLLGPQQRRTGLSGRADEFLAAEQESNNILKNILNTMQARLLQSRMKYRQMLRQARTSK